MTEPKPSAQYEIRAQAETARAVRSVPVVLALDWAQAVTRQQQLLNECEGGVVRVCLFRDERGLVRVEAAANG
jgi:hypothetical protein